LAEAWRVSIVGVDCASAVLVARAKSAQQLIECFNIGRPLVRTLEEVLRGERSRVSTIRRRQREIRLCGERLSVYGKFRGFALRGYVFFYGAA
jgi:hypothetical protein